MTLSRLMLQRLSTATRARLARTYASATTETAVPVSQVLKPTATTSTATTAAVSEAAAPAIARATTAASEAFRAAPAPPPKRQIGAVRGGIIGLLLGFVVSGATGYYYLLDDYQVYSNALLSNVDKLSQNVDEIQRSLGKVARLETEVKTLQKGTIQRDELERLRKEVLKSLDAATVETLELKTRLWSLEHDKGQK
ncbi:hypothetical protein RI367_005717 [Sorochytrium milnesiophthora]